ncbi:MAG TPA: DUF2255 family protein [Galbitalea sp.]|jgi:hypothetical protein|nr:DUF2255 family protein [Galbitalea sp.]
MPATEWTEDLLRELSDTEELVLVVSRTGYDTIRVPVWVVAVDGDVYLRSYKGVTSMWFRRVETDADQSIHVDSADVPVHFENVDRLDHVNRAIDAEFNRKYARFDYVSAMSEPAAVEATLRVLPR